jgi:GT2 family glycosyltransferase
LSNTLSIWTIVVTHNAETVIATCLSSLEASTVPTKILLIDNGSEDATIELVKRDFPSVIVDAGVNLGFPGGCNRGVLLAGDDATAYFFLNPDAEVSPTCLEQLLNALNENNQLAVVSPTVRHPESGLIEYAGAMLDFANLDFGIIGYGEVDLEAFRGMDQTGRPTGAVMLVRRSSLDAVGPMDASYFLYWEECEWAWRFIRNGFQIGYVPDAMVLHSRSHSTGGSGSKIYEYYYTRNLLRLVAEVKELSKFATLRQLLPFLAHRLKEIASRRKMKPFVTAVYFDFLGIVDFLRGRYGPHAGLPPGAKFYSVSE